MVADDVVEAEPGPPVPGPSSLLGLGSFGRHAKHQYSRLVLKPFQVFSITAQYVGGVRCFPISHVSVSPSILRVKSLLTKDTWVVIQQRAAQQSTRWTNEDAIHADGRWNS